MANSPESPSSPNKASRRKRILATGTAILALSTGTAVALKDQGNSRHNATSTPTTLEVPATTSSTLPETTTTQPKPKSTTSTSTSTTTTPETTTLPPTTTTFESPTTSTTEAVTTTTTKAEDLSNPYENLNLRGSELSNNLTLAALRLLKDEAPEFYKPIKHILDSQEVIIELLPDGQGRRVYPTRPVATITLDQSQLNAGVLEMAAGYVNDFGHIKQVNTYLEHHPKVDKLDVPYDIYASTDAEDAMIRRQAAAQTALGDTQANIDRTLSFIGHPSQLVG